MVNKSSLLLVIMGNRTVIMGLPELSSPGQCQGKMISHSRSTIHGNMESYSELTGWARILVTYATGPSWPLC